MTTIEGDLLLNALLVYSPPGQSSCSFLVERYDAVITIMDKKGRFPIMFSFLFVPHFSHYSCGKVSVLLRVWYLFLVYIPISRCMWVYRQLTSPSLISSSLYSDLNKTTV